MHKACYEERDRPCNAYCEGDVHADLAYFGNLLSISRTLADQKEALQRVVDMQATAGEKYSIEVLDIAPAPEAPSVDIRYAPTLLASAHWQAYLVRYRLRT